MGICIVVNAHQKYTAFSFITVKYEVVELFASLKTLSNSLHLLEPYTKCKKTNKKTTTI